MQSSRSCLSYAWIALNLRHSHEMCRAREADLSSHSGHRLEEIDEIPSSFKAFLVRYSGWEIDGNSEKLHATGGINPGWVASVSLAEF